MNVVQVNVRLNEGGAASIALDLHRRLLHSGINSIYFYGYGLKAKPSADEGRYPQVRRLGGTLQVMSNFALHRFAGVEWFLPPKSLQGAFLEALADADVVHLHVTHSYYLPLGWLTMQLCRTKARIVWTLHDFWLMTGRCAFLEGCMSWRNGCGQCPTMLNYPPALIDLSARVHKSRRRLVESLRGRLVLAAPSKFVARMASSAFPDIPVKLIPNGLDIEMERALRTTGGRWTGRERGAARILIVANDLADPTKVDRDIVASVLELPGCELHAVGKNSPFSGANVINYGLIRDRKRLVEIMTSCDALLFTSRKDTFGLVMAEALACGTQVIAVDSEAAQEVLGAVGHGPEKNVRQAVENLIMNPVPASFREALRETSLRVFSGDSMLNSHLELYRRDGNIWQN